MIAGPFNFFWVNSRLNANNYYNLSVGLFKSNTFYWIMFLGIYVPKILSYVKLILIVLNLPPPSRYDKICDKYLPLALFISNIFIIYIYMNWISEIPKELFADLFMEQNSILNSTREFKRPSSCGIFADMTIFMDYFHECFPILTFIITELKITDVLPPEVSTCGLLYTTTIGAWFGNLIDTPVLLFIIGNYINRVLILFN